MLARLAPPILGGALAAALVDRLPKEGLLARLEVVRALAAVGAAVAVLFDFLPGVLVALAVVGAGAALVNVAVSALVPALVPDDELQAANGCVGLSYDVGIAVGALGGALALSLVGVLPALDSWPPSSPARRRSTGAPRRPRSRIGPRRRPRCSVGAVVCSAAERPQPRSEPSSRAPSAWRS